MDRCPLCKTSELIPTGHEVDCTECGRYEASHTLAATVIEIEAELLTAIQAFIASENAKGKTPQLDSGNWIGIVERNRKPALP